MRVFRLPGRSTRRRGRFRCGDGAEPAGWGWGAGDRRLSRKFAGGRASRWFLAVDSRIWHEFGAAASGAGAWSEEESSG